MARQYVLHSLPTPVIVNETAARQEIVLTTFLDETVATAVSGMAWDTSDADVDPFFYEWWRKKQEEVLSPFAEEIEEQAEPAEATVAEAVKQIGNVQTFNQLDERSALIRADLLETVRELRAEFLRMKEDEDDVETILMLL